MMRSILLLFFFITGCRLGYAYPSLDSQDSTKTLHSHELKEVIVNDRRTRHQVSTSGLSVEQVDHHFIRQQSGGTLMGSLSALPGIQSLNIGSGQSKPMIRGLTANQVLVIDQGVRHEGQEWGVDHGLEIDQFQVGTATIIKGPAAMRFGSGVLGGVIVLEPHPTPNSDSIGGSIDLLGKSNNQLYGSSFSLFRTFTSWSFNGRITALTHADHRVPTDSVSIYNYTVNLPNGKVRNTAGRELGLALSTKYRQSNFETQLSGSAYYVRAGFFANAHGLEPRNVDEALHDQSNRDIQLPHQRVRHLKLINRSKWNIHNHQLQMDLGVQHNSRLEHSPYVNHGYMPAQFPDHLPFTEQEERTYNKWMLNANLRDQWSIGNHRLEVGLQGGLQDNQIGGWNYLSPAFHQYNVALYAMNEVTLGPNTTVSVGLRYDRNKIHTKSYQDWFVSTFINPDGVLESTHFQRSQSLQKQYSNLAWSVGLVHQKENYAINLHLGTGFRMPIAKELAAHGVNYHYFRYEKGSAELSPEKSYQLDMGITANHHRFRFHIQPFINYFSNYIFLSPTHLHDYTYAAGHQIFQYTQTAVSRLGGEARVDFHINRFWTLGLDGEYVYSRQLSGDMKSYTLPLSPPYQIGLNLHFRPNSTSFFQQPSILLEQKFIGKQHLIVPPELPTPGTQITNLSIGTTLPIHQQSLSTHLKISNLWNTQYEDHLSFYRLIGLPEAGRNISLNIHYTF